MPERGRGLLERARSLLAVPSLRDPIDAVSVALVARTIEMLAVAAGLFAALAAVSGSLTVRDMEIVALGFAALVGLRVALHRGRRRTVAVALCLVAWLAVAADLQVHGSDTIAAGGFIIVVVVGGLTLGLAGALVISAATIALLAVMLFGGGSGGLSGPAPRERLTHYITQLALAATLAGWWAVRTRGILSDLRRSEARRTLLLEASPDAIVSCDASGVVTYQNRATEHILGYPAREIVGRPWHASPVVNPAAIEQVKPRFTATLHDGIDLPLEEFTLKHADGHEVIVETRSVPLVEDGGVVGMVSILRDVTARRKAEEERASLQRQLASAQRMEAVGLVAGGVAHDFNNLLTVILAAVEVPDEESIDDIREAARRGVTLTRQLLAFTGCKPSDPRPIRVDDAIVAIRPMLARLLGEACTLDLQLAAPALTVIVDAGYIDQVLVNLAANARDAMPAGGSLTISTRTLDGAIELKVEDTGTGMDAATVASAFQPFFTTKGARGTGLGLAVVSNIVREAHGTITVDSEPGRGTRFVFRFPAGTDVPDDRVSVPMEPPAHTRRLVLVDDNALVRRAAARTLAHSGFAVEAFDGTEDIAAIEARLEGADALVLDVVMPGRSGVDLALELRHRGCQLPILFVSGYAEHSLLERIREVSLSALLPKPFAASHVVARIGELQTGVRSSDPSRV